MTGAEHPAEDVTQAVFVALAQNAARLVAHPVLSGWLHTTARHLAAKTVRASARRQLREQEAAAMNQLLSADDETSWEHVAPHLDDALGELNDAERDALLLRYFENKSAPEIANVLGISDAAAQKRVSRAVERLRELFARRGVTVGAGGLAVVISANAVQAAPVGLAVTISAAASVGTTGTASTLAVTTTKAIAMTTLQKTIVAAAVAALAGVGVYEARQAAQLNEQNQALRQRQVPMVEQIQQLQSELGDATNRLASLREDNEQSISNRNQNELLKLRREISGLRRQANEADQRAHIAEQKLETSLSSESQFRAHESATINAAKQVGLGMHLYSLDHDNQLPSDLAQLKNELGGSFTIGGIDLFRFELVNPGAGRIDHPNMVSIRERLSRQAPDGTWKRIYTFADGSVHAATSHDGNFDDWEKQNTYSPSQNQTQEVSDNSTQ
jgi:RNA polymerase sigma factor (sigma-70 family)